MMIGEFTPWNALKAENYQVVTASDGLQALEIAYAVDVMILI